MCLTKSIMFRNIRITIAALLLAGCTSALTYRDFDDPIFFANQSSGYCSDCKWKSGLLAAVWPDGRILRARSDEEVGRTYSYGTLKAEDLDFIRRSVKDLYEQNIQSPGVPIDFSSRDIWTYPEGVGSIDSPNYFYAIDDAEGYRPDEVLGEIMRMEMENSRSLTWNELPRFAPPVHGVWTSRGKTTENRD